MRTDEGLRQETFYVTQRRFDRDTVDVYVVRYTFDGTGGPLRAEHLCPEVPNGDPHWFEHGAGLAMRPAMSIPGILADLLVRTDPYVPEATSAAEQAVEALIAKVLGGR